MTQALHTDRPLTPALIRDPQRRAAAMRSRKARRLKNRLFLWLCVGVASLSVVTLAVFLALIGWQGAEHLSWNFLTSPPHPDPLKAGIYPALWGTIWLCAICALATLPLGVATAIFLEEFRPRSRWLKPLHGFVQLNLANLAGVPSVVYGIIGLTVFANMFNFAGSPEDPAFEVGTIYQDQYLSEGDQVLLVPAGGPESPARKLRDGMKATMATVNDSGKTVHKTVELNVIGPDSEPPENQRLLHRTLRADAYGSRISKEVWYYFRVPFGRGVLAGGLTLMLVILPVVIIASQEALRAVPDVLGEGALGMGATRWRVVRDITLPAAAPGIMTGSIIAMSRAIGEAAPLLMIAGIVYIRNAPNNLMSDFTAMSLQIYNWAQRPQQPFQEVAASGIIVLLIVLLSFNAVAVLIRQRMQMPLT